MSLEFVIPVVTASWFMCSYNKQSAYGFLEFIAVCRGQTFRGCL